MISQAFITAWRGKVPWQDDAQVEQDLVLTRALIELFGSAEIADGIALRGGTALNKLFLFPGARYSEDIDLVQTTVQPAGLLFDGIGRVLNPWLGKPKRTMSGANISLVYRFESEIAPVRPLRLKIEINTREHFSVLGLREQELSVDNPWFSGTAKIRTYRLDELLGTKLRALYQRRKGRDLFDLWMCLDRGLIDARLVVDCFGRYMEAEGQRVTRAQFEQNLHEKAMDRGFMGDIGPLLAAGTEYESTSAMKAVRERLVALLPGEPWKG